MRLSTGLSVALTLSLSATVAQAEEFRFLSMWQSAGERRALERIATAAEAAGFEWINEYTSGNFLGTRAEFTRSLVQDSPYNGVQLIIGSELRSLVDAGIIEPVTLSGEDIDSLFVPDLLPAILLGGNRLTSLPVSIHGQNHILMNTDILTRAGVSVPATFTELLQALPKIQSAGFIPITLSDEPWQMRILFMSILSTLVDQEQFGKMLEGDLDPTVWEPALITAFEYLGQIRDFANPDYAGLLWQDSTAKVLNGSAAFQILGDYIGSEITWDGPYHCSIIPGAQFFLWGADGVAFVKQPSEEFRERMTYLVRTLSETVLRQGFTYEKGGVPVVRNFDIGDLKPCSRQNVADWERFEGRRIFLTDDYWRTTLEAIGGIVASYVTEASATSISEAAERLLNSLGARR